VSSTHIALLRGINVGGHNRVPMAELRSRFEGLGHERVATHVQSGNVVFESAAVEAAIVSGVEQAIREQFGFAVPVVVRSHSELAAVADRHPLAGDGPDEAKLHVFFIAKAPEAATAPGLDASRFAPDEFMLDGRELYIHYPNGRGRSKLTVAQVERGWLSSHRPRRRLRSTPPALCEGNPPWLHHSKDCASSTSQKASPARSARSCSATSGPLS
jgi:uncharacterized protein (DUF1697 family)